MWVSVSNKCVGCGACSKICPDVFEIYKSSSIPDLRKVSGNEEHCIDAALNCPVSAISIDEH